VYNGNFQQKLESAHTRTTLGAIEKRKSLLSFQSLNKKIYKIFAQRFEQFF